MYEKELKNQLKSYIKSGDAEHHASTQMRFRGLNDLFEYIQKAHKEYLQKMRNVAEDIQYIMNICYQVFQGILQIFAKQEQRGCTGYDLKMEHRRFVDALLNVQIMILTIVKYGLVVFIHGVDLTLTSHLVTCKIFIIGSDFVD